MKCLGYRRSRPAFAALAVAFVAGGLVAGCAGQVGTSSDGDGDGEGGQGGDGSGGDGDNGGGGGTPVSSDGLGRLSPDEVKAQCSGGRLDPGLARLARLTRREYDNTIQDLLGDDARLASKDFPTDERWLNFDNNSDKLTVSPPLAEAYQDAAAALAARAVERNFAKLVTCDGAKDPNGCGASFIASFGKRAFRRPLDDAEKARYDKVLKQGLQTDFKNGIKLVIEAMLQSAPFLYRPEWGEAPKSGDTSVRLSSWEMASRLSYFLWGTMPDDELFRQAEAGKLTDRAEIARQVQRLLGDGRARTTIQSFHEQWLSLGDVVSLDKDTALFPVWTAESTKLLKEETNRFVDEVVATNQGFDALLRAPFTMANGALAKHYGLTGSGVPTGADWKKVDLDRKQRSGVLTHGSILAYEAGRNQTNPVRRGKFVRESLLCDRPPPPPPGLMVQPPDLDPKLTTRERFSAHKEVAGCRECHQLLDPIGLGLENFDAVGVYRATENGKPVDASGEVFGTDVEGKFNGPIELADKLASSQQVKRCYVTNWFRFANKRSDTDTKADACLLQQLDAKFRGGAFDVKKLIVALTESDAFLYTRAGVGP